MKYILKWNDATEEDVGGEERFDTKEELIERLKELKETYEDEIEYEYYPAERCKCCGTWIKKSETKGETKEEAIKMFEKDGSHDGEELIEVEE